jgi:hypothetical protein
MNKKNIISLAVLAAVIMLIFGFALISKAATIQTMTEPPPANSKDVGQWQINMEQRKAKFEAINTALKNNNYKAWVLAVGSDSDQVKTITEEKFPRLIEAYNLEQEARANLDEAKNIRKALGLKKPAGKNMFFGKFHKDLPREQISQNPNN